MSPNVKIVGMGACLPERVVTNAMLEDQMETTAHFISERTGIQTRRYVSENERNVDLMCAAIRKACQSSKVKPSEIDLLIVNTVSPDYIDPSQACLIQHVFPELQNIPAFDIKAQCSGFLYGCYLAQALLKAEEDLQYALVVCGEILSRRVIGNHADRNLGVLVGDGATATILSRSEDHAGFQKILLKSNGASFFSLYTEGVGNVGNPFHEVSTPTDFLFTMDGKAVKGEASRLMAEIAQTVLAKCHLSLGDISHIIPHQPNIRLLEDVANLLKLNVDQMEVSCDKYGNIASVSQPLTFLPVWKRARSGEFSLLVSFGSGVTWAGGIYRH